MVNIGYGNDKRTRHVLPNGAVCIQRQGVGNSAHALGLGLGFFVQPCWVVREVGVRVRGIQQGLGLAWWWLWWWRWCSGAQAVTHAHSHTRTYRRAHTNFA